jgi:hypothetical protein
VGRKLWGECVSGLLWEGGTRAGKGIGMVCCVHFKVPKVPGRSGLCVVCFQGPQSPEEGGMVCCVLFKVPKVPGRAPAVLPALQAPVFESQFQDCKIETGSSTHRVGEGRAEGRMCDFKWLEVFFTVRKETTVATARSPFHFLLTAAHALHDVCALPNLSCSTSALPGSSLRCSAGCRQSAAESDDLLKWAFS